MRRYFFPPWGDRDELPLYVTIKKQNRKENKLSQNNEFKLVLKN